MPVPDRAARREAAPGGRRVEGLDEAVGDGEGRGHYAARAGIALAVVLGVGLRGCVLLLVVVVGSASGYGRWR